MGQRSPSRSTQLKLAYAVLAAVDATFAGASSRTAHRARMLTKPLLMPALAASLALSPAAHGSPLRTTTLAAQAGGWGGDIALLGNGPRAFLSGTGSFAAGHAAYITGFDRLRARSGGAERPARALLGLWALTGPVLALGASRRDRSLGLPVAAYSAVLTTMVASATRLDPSLPAAVRRCAFAGAGLFLVSDTLLGLRMFLLPHAPDRLESVVMATYTAGQFLLSEAAARASA